MIKGSLLLEGGATRGVFTAGAVDYLMEQDYYFSHLIGVSAGACNAVDYVSKQIGRSRDCWIHKEKEYDYYYKFPQIFKNRSMMNMKMIFEEYPNEIYPFDFNTYFASDMTCEIVVTNCQTGQAEYLTEKTERKRLMDVCRASCSLPLISPIVNISGIPYLDGGLADSLPIRRGIEIGNKKIVVMLTREKGYRKSYPRKGEVKLYRHIYRQYPKLVSAILTRPLVYNRTMAFIEELEKKGHVFVLRPEVKPIKRMEKNYDTLMEFYDHGYTVMKQQFSRLKDFME